MITTALVIVLKILFYFYENEGKSFSMQSSFKQVGNTPLIKLNILTIIGK